MFILKIFLRHCSPNYTYFLVKCPKIRHFDFFFIFLFFFLNVYCTSSFVQIIMFLYTVLEKIDLKVLCPLNSILWLTVSKAFLKSMKMPHPNLPLSIDAVICTSAYTVELFFLNPY